MFLSSGNFQSAGIAFPVYSDYSIALAFNITPFSRKAYDVTVNETDAGINQIFTGSGGCPRHK